MFYIPFVRTLKLASDNTVKTVKEVTSTVEGQEVKTFVEEELPQEEVIKYIAEGNYKWFVLVVCQNSVHCLKYSLGHLSRLTHEIWNAQ